MDMAGNVSEWTSSLDCDYRTKECTSLGPGREIYMMRGSGWGTTLVSAKPVTWRLATWLEATSDGLGFHCAR